MRMSLFEGIIQWRTTNRQFLSRKNEGVDVRQGQGKFENDPLDYERNIRLPTAASLAF
jgi:hypothetical protein